MKPMALPKIDHVLLLAPPGSGKTLWAKRQAEKPIPEVLKNFKTCEPDAARIQRLAGVLQSPLKVPFRAPHHTVSLGAITGKFTRPWCFMPGELSLAHGGIFFMDEATEFRTPVVNAILEAAIDDCIALPNGNGSVQCVPTSFRFIAAANPCSCGWLGTQHKQCQCSEKAFGLYKARLARFEQVCRAITADELKAQLT